MIDSVPAPESGEAVERALIRRVDECGLSPGMVVGVIDGDHRASFARGRERPSGEPVNEQTVFEIGSITKLFTALLLAGMARRGEVSLDTARCGPAAAGNSGA